MEKEGRLPFNAAISLQMVESSPDVVDPTSLCKKFNKTNIIMIMRMMTMMMQHYYLKTFNWAA